MKLSTWFYRVLLWLYPSEHRAAYGDLMMQAFRDMAREAQTRGGTAGLLRLWPGVLLDTLKAAYAEYRDMPTNPHVQVYSRLHIIIALSLPLGLIVYFFFGRQRSDVPSIYMCLLLGGVGIVLLRRFRLIPAAPLWNAYTAGVLLGIISLISFFAFSLPAFGVYRLGLSAFWIAGASAVVYTLLIGLTSRLFQRRVWEYRIVAAFLAVTSLIGQLASLAELNSDDISRSLSISYAWMQAAGVLLTTGVGAALARRWGRAGLVTLMVGLGTQFIIVDPGYFTGQAGRWIDLIVVMFPLVICPAWWLAAKSRRAQTWGTAVLWGLFIVLVAFLPNIARLTFVVDFVTPGRWVFGLLGMLPYAAAMWLALREVDAEGRDVVVSEESLAPVPDAG